MMGKLWSLAPAVSGRGSQERGLTGGVRMAWLVGFASLVGVASPQASAREGGEDQITGVIAGKVDSILVTETAAVVYVKDASGEFPPPKEKVVLDQRNLTFVPHVLAVLKGSTVAFPNNDIVRHNVFSPARSAKQFNLGLYPPGSTKDVTFPNVGVVPLLCNVHSDMSAFVVVLPNPYYATTDESGNFTIKNVPPGQYQLTFWHEELTPQTAKVPVTAGKTAKVTFKNPRKALSYEVDLLK